MSTLVPFVARSAAAKGVPVGCGARETFSGGAVAWMVEVGAHEHFCLWVRLLDKQVQLLSPSRNITSLVIAVVRRWLLTVRSLRQFDAILLGGLLKYYFLSLLAVSSASGANFLSLFFLFQVSLLVCALHCFGHRTAFPGAQGRGPEGGTAMTNINISELFMCILNMQNVICCNWFCCFVSGAVMSSSLPPWVLRTGMLNFGLVPVISLRGARSGRARRVSLHKVVVGRALLLCRAELPTTWREGNVPTLSVLEGHRSAHVWADGCSLQVAVRDKGVFPGQDGRKFGRWDGRKQFHDPGLLPVKNCPCF